MLTVVLMHQNISRTHHDVKGFVWAVVLVMAVLPSNFARKMGAKDSFISLLALSFCSRVSFCQERRFSS